MGKLRMFIYVITCHINGKKYVGIDSGPETEMRRWRAHRALCKPKGRSKLYSALVKHGLDNFSVDVVSRAETIPKLKQLEKDWIKKLDSIKQGYNILPGGQGYGRLSEMSLEDAAIQLEAIKRGSKKANEVRWSGTTLEDRQAILKKCHDSYSSEERSRNVKANWDSLSPDERQKKTDGIRRYWNSKPRKEKSPPKFPRSYTIATEDTIRTCTNLKQFCKENGLDYVKAKECIHGKRNDLNGFQIRRNA